MAELNRRSFLRFSSAAAGCSLLVGVEFGSDAEAASKKGKEAPEDALHFAPSAWLELTSDDQYIFYCDKCEMGQGVYTSLSMILADELELEPDRLQVRAALPGRDEYKHAEFGVQITGGSTSVRTMYEPLRRAGATARYLMLQAAANQWSIPVDQCAAVNGEIREKEGERFASYGTLLKAAQTLDVPDEVPLKDPKDFRYIGKSLGRLDNQEKVTGKAVYGVDVLAGDPLIASVVRCPIIGGSLKTLDGSKARKAPGVVDVFQITSGIAVVGESYWQVQAARKLLEVEWVKGEQTPESSEAIMAGFKKAAEEEEGTNFTDVGKTEALQEAADDLYEAEYEIPYMAHAAMEPVNCTADVRKDECIIYAPTQGAGIAQVVAAEILGLPNEKVTVHTTLLGGGFGRRLNQDFVADAVECSAKVKRPVKVMMSREDDIQNDAFRPGNFHRLKATLTNDGKVESWSHKIVGPSVMRQIVPEWTHAMVPQWMPVLLRRFAGWSAGNLIEMSGQDETSVEGAANLAYDIPNTKVDYVFNDPGVSLGFWRSVGHSYTGFVVEGFADELAHKAGRDPLEFRLSMLEKEEKRAQVLRIASQKAGWGRELPKGRGLGIAQVQSFGSYAAQVAEVEILDGDIKVRKITCAVDCGLVVNPDQVIAQIESGIVFGMSAALMDPITIEAGRIKTDNFDSYRVARMRDMPEIEVHIVPGGSSPQGAGEPGVPPVAPAIANAVFAATGKRLRKLPLRLPV